MRFLPALAALLLAAAPLLAEPPMNGLVHEKFVPETYDWKSLFDGKDASANWRGFKMETLPAGWVVRDGLLIRDVSIKQGGDIITKGVYESFEFSCEWRISPGGNSGVMFKVLETAPRAAFSGPECQIQDDTAGHDPQKSGWCYGLYPASVDTTKPVGEWNLMVVKCQRLSPWHYHCEHWMNGTKYVDYEIGSDDWNERVAKSKFASTPDWSKAIAGHIALQDHGTEVAFRNLKIKVLK
jgi:hypothetical protein